MKKFLVLHTIALGVLAMAGSAFAIGNKNASKVSAETAITAIGEDEYEAAFFEQYCDVECISTENYSYANDRPIGNDTIGGFLYGDVGNNAKLLKKTNYVTNLRGINPTLEWRFSGLNVKSKTNPTRLYIQLENNSSDWNICNAESFPQDTNPDEYAIGQIILADGCAKGASMVSTTAIANIQDISVYWRTSYTKRIYVLYQLEGETEWKKLSGTGSNDAGNYTGERGWDAHGYTTFRSESWKTKELYGATAKIAIACTEAPTESGNLPLSAIVINADKAAAKYLNHLSYNEGVCDAETKFDLKKTEADKTHNQQFFQMVTERASADFLNDCVITGTKTTETNALSMYNYFVSVIPGLGTVKTPSTRYFGSLFAGGNYATATVVLVSALTVITIGFGAYFILRKKRA